MCGIIGYIGKNKAQEIILHGLNKLEYRGYDSSGISVINGEITTIKATGKLENLEKLLINNELKGNVGIGHTRWATHGYPTKVNAHPHISNKGNISVVHNGIIENYLEIKKILEKDGIIFKSETDTEILPNLIEKYYKENILEAVQRAVKELKGTYAICVISKKEPDKIIVLRKESPLIIGIGEGENFIASDVPALLKYTKKVKYLEDDNIAVITKNKVVIYDSDNNIINLDTKEIEWSMESATKEGYPHFMIKEIFEQPKALYDTFFRRLKKDKIELDDIKLSKEYIDNIDKIHIIGCGTAYHAGLIGKSMIEELVDVPVEVSISSEFRYTKQFISDKTLVIIISQSGETLDTLVALKKAKEKGARILAITNVVGSSIDRIADDVLYTWAGPEIAVASTKAFTTQVASLYMIALNMSLENQKIDERTYKHYIDEIKEVPRKIKKILDNRESIKDLTKITKDITKGFYLGRGLDYYMSMEGSLKMKEISYIHTEAFPSGELKHGSIALIEEGTFVIFVATQEYLYEKTLSNIKEVRSRGAKVITITKENNKIYEGISNEIIYLPEADDNIIPLYAVVALQLLAYYTSVVKGNDVDKPRNLAKSVTVE